MSRFCFSIAILILSAGCQTLSRQQRSAVGQFAAKTIEFSSSPKALLDELSEIRESRGIYYAASFTDPALHLAELDNIARDKIQDEKFSLDAGMAFRVLEQYAEGLKQLSDDKPFKKTEENYTRLGKDLEKLVAAYNEADSKEPIPAGIGLLFTKSAEVATRGFLARRQARALREFVMKADTMVAAICTEMASILSMQEMGKLIDAEASGLTESFRFYYARKAPVSIAADREYVALKKRAETLVLLLEKTARTTGQLRTAHRKLAVEISAKCRMKDISDELLDYYKEAEEIRELIRKL